MFEVYICTRSFTYYTDSAATVGLDFGVFIILLGLLLHYTIIFRL